MLCKSDLRIRDSEGNCQNSTLLKLYIGHPIPRMENLLENDVNCPFKKIYKPGIYSFSLSSAYIPSLCQHLDIIHQLKEFTPPEGLTEGGGVAHKSFVSVPNMLKYYKFSTNLWSSWWPPGLFRKLPCLRPAPVHRIVELQQLYKRSGRHVLP